MRRITRLLSWKYHETVESPGTPIQTSIFACREAYLEGQSECPSGWTRHPISENPEARYETPDPRIPSSWFYKHATHPGFDFWYPIPLPRPGDMFSSVLAPYVSCRTQRAWLFPAEEILKRNGYRPVLSLRDQVGTWAGVLQPHGHLPGETLEMLTEAIELVEIAIGLCRDTTSPWPGLEEIRHEERLKTGQWYEYYRVMWVEWTDGIAYRKGLGRVCKHIWEEQERKPIHLILGSSGQSASQSQFNPEVIEIRMSHMAKTLLVALS